MTEVENSEPTPPLATWTVPSGNGVPPTVLVARAGESTIVVGANGAGKSALGVFLDANSDSQNTFRVIAHRRLWMQSAGGSLSAAERIADVDYWKSRRRDPSSRYVDVEEARRSGIVLFDLLAREADVNSTLARTVRSGIKELSELEDFEPSPVDVLNSVLKDAGLSIQVRVGQNQDLYADNTERAAQYPIHQASDGEKAALLLAAEILVAPAASVVILDEPERHLHRSISARLVASVLASRLDCHFVVLTHDIELAEVLATTKGRAYALTDSVWADGAATGWELFPVDSADGSFDTARRAILGGRRDVLFVEGKERSEDQQLYKLLFPEFTLAPLGGSDQVSRTVAGLRESGTFHWVRAVGIVDQDGRDAAEKATLSSRGVLVLGVSEVENLYYMSCVIDDVAEQQGERFGLEGATLAATARTEALASLKQPGVTTHLAEVLAIADLRRRAMGALPKKLAGEGAEVLVRLPSSFATIKAEADGLVSAGAFDDIVRRLPIRDSAFRTKVAKQLKFQSEQDYQAFVRVRLSQNAALLKAMRVEVGGLPV